MTPLLSLSLLNVPYHTNLRRMARLFVVCHVFNEAHEDSQHQVRVLMTVDDDRPKDMQAGPLSKAQDSS